MPVDHAVRDMPVSSAIRWACRPRGMAVGAVRHSAGRPATGFGYIRMGDPGRGLDDHNVDAFVEKPDS